MKNFDFDFRLKILIIYDSKRILPKENFAAQIISGKNFFLLKFVLSHI